MRRLMHATMTEYDRTQKRRPMHATMTEYDRTVGKGDAVNKYLCKEHAVNIGYQYPHVTINNTLYHVAAILLNIT